jgi:Ser/Thr protein kinase RdoA (MazF antagonist)
VRAADGDRDEVPLTGGEVTPGVVRVGDTVRRPMARAAPFVHALLRHLEAVGFPGAPRLLGVDDAGREMLTFVPGEVVLDGPPLDEAQLAAAARLVRAFHDATAGTALAGASEVVCHTDLGPHNTVFRDGRPIALIDWGDAAPGARLDDLADAVWCYGGIGAGGGPLRVQARRIAVLCDAYGWDDRAAVVAEIGARLARALARHEREGRPAAAAVFRPMVEWWRAHERGLGGARRPPRVPGRPRA